MSTNTYILFRIDVYFIEYFLAIEIGKQRHKGRELFFFLKKKKKRQKALEKNLVMIRGYDRGYDRL